MEERKLNRRGRSIRRVDKVQKGYLLGKGKETEGMCKSFK